MALRPETAFRRQADGSVLEVPAAELAVGDVVILRPGARFDAEAIKAHAAQRLARYKVPALVLVLEAFPVAEGGNGAKVQKAALRQLAADHGSPGAR